jgi:glycerol-3-phosphate dehydrogenase
MASRFSAETREAVLAARPGASLDHLVVGGGITGAGVARDAALRGLRTALIERADFASGTSSRSSKLIHGGVRYLQQGDVGLVREAASERQVLRRIAPHRTTPLRMVMPTYGRAMHAKLGVGLWTFEKLATVPPDERYASWSRDEALAAEPLLDATRLHGAVTFFEYLTDDARLVLDTVKGAHRAGALCANHAGVVGLRREGGLTTVEIEERLAGRRIAARARIVVNAAGPWVDELRDMAGDRGRTRLHLTKGIHLVVRRERLPLRAIVVMQAEDKRSVFAVPRGEYVYLGTTDTDYGPPAEEPEVTLADAAYLLAAANRTFAGAPLRPGDVVAAWAGLRPLLHEEGKSPSEISRRDEILGDPASGLVSIAGGKLTTYRKMAERTVDLVCDALGKRAKPCATGDETLPGGELDPEALRALGAALPARVPALGVPGAERLVFLYGAEADGVATRAERDPEAARILGGDPPALAAEVLHALESEMAMTLGDLLERRMRLLLFDAHQGLDAADAVAALAAPRLGWDADRTAAELAAYRRHAASLRSFA